MTPTATPTSTATTRPVETGEVHLFLPLIVRNGEGRPPTATPIDAGRYVLPGRQFDLAVAADTVYLAGDAGLLVVRVELPGN